jgi:D-sedoheptulose 7-phosphate isomerase
MQQIENYIAELQDTLSQLPIDLISQMIESLQEARMRGRQVFIMGNGGSASTASHFVCDLAKNTRKEGWPHFRVIGLTDNMAIFSAYANDEGYENVFAQQLGSLVRPNDVVIAISASGNSPNVLKAVQTARDHRAKTIGFTGFDGGRLGSMVDLHLHVPSNCIEMVEDIHLSLEHMIVKTLKEITQSTAPQFQPFEAPARHFERADALTEQLFGTPVEVADTLEAVQTRDSVKLLYDISRELADKIDMHDLLPRILQLTLGSVGAVRGSIVVLDDEGNVVEGAWASPDKVQPFSMQELADLLEHGLAGWVVENRQAALIPSTRDDPRWLSRSYGDEEKEDASRSALSVPLMAHDRVVGVLTMVHPKPGQFTHEDLALLTAVAVTLSFKGSNTLAGSEK